MPQSKLKAYTYLPVLRKSSATKCNNRTVTWYNFLANRAIDGVIDSRRLLYITYKGVESQKADFDDRRVNLRP